ncbi:hypothetical protein BWI93_00110 [Siphonobacter sp. BAB-5385]|uniref:hypothetical protein n=1 Tax=Siphonobacter sp. BAB-5385 TaxID=1864822 RepID=UPI000B9E851E|nr:hypothetical protein [Siphonobacter sp. BAB-5385]OZI10170.1 hypothetical protein BWI93_00110 [Siphonobacter sp. BAB-5385]
MEAAYTVFLSIHSWLRWVVLILAVLTLARSARGVSSRSLYTDADRKAGLFFMISCDVQLLVGLVLYLGLSPVGLAAFQTEGLNPMKESGIRYYAVEHIAIMIVALALVHIGYSKAKKATSDLVKHKSSLIFFGIALVLMLSRIPFSTRPLFRF